MHALKFARVTCSIDVRGHRDPMLATLAPGQATCAGGHLLGLGPSLAWPLLAAAALSCSSSPCHVALPHHLRPCRAMLPPAPTPRHYLSVTSTAPHPLSTASLHRCRPQPVPVSAARTRPCRRRLSIDGTAATYGRAFPRTAWVSNTGMGTTSVTPSASCLDEDGQSTHLPPLSLSSDRMTPLVLIGMGRSPLANSSRPQLSH
jgi:hypothetical protein